MSDRWQSERQPRGGGLRAERRMLPDRPALGVNNP